jgi:hypothetical protein
VSVRELKLVRGRHSKRPGSSVTVNIHVHDLSQMFNSLDPSPFWDRDLDRAAAEFIEEEFSEKAAADEWHLSVHAHEGTGLTADLQAAIENYYARLATSARRALREHWWIGQLALLGGAAVFTISVGAREILQHALGSLPPVLDEGLIILGWLALWRPADVLMYEWVPLYRKRRRFERLAGIRVSVRPAGRSTAGPNAGRVQPRLT